MTRKFLRTAARLCCAGLCLLTARAALAGRGQPGAHASLERVAAEHRAHVFAARPDLATRFGWRGAERRLAPITQATLERDRALLADLDARAQRIDRASLAPGDAIALDSLRSRLAAERAPLESGAWRRDPALYLAPGPLAVLEVANAPRVSPCMRSLRAARRLQYLPELLRAAEISLRDAREGDREHATSLWNAALDSLSFALPARLAACHDPARTADLVEADTLAIMAMRRFVRFLSNDWPNPAGATK